MLLYMALYLWKTIQLPLPSSSHSIRLLPFVSLRGVTGELVHEGGDAEEVAERQLGLGRQERFEEVEEPQDPRC